MEYTMELKPQDVLVLFMQVADDDHAWTYAALGVAFQMSAAQVHRSVKRCMTSGLAVEKARGEVTSPPMLIFTLARLGGAYRSLLSLEAAIKVHLAALEISETPGLRWWFA